MTTASVLVTVGTTWSSCEKVEKDERVDRCARSTAAVAARELRETPSTREQALRIMRDWIEKNADVKNVRLDESFLLRFLRQKKFSIPMAQQTLLKYLNIRQIYPEAFAKLDCEDPKMEEIFNKGYITVSPVRDDKGRRIVVYNMGSFDAMRYTCWEMCRAHTLVYETLLEHPEDQVCGFTHVGNGGGVTGAHVTIWKPNDFARLIKWGEQSLPMRHKEFHLINIPATIKYIIDFASSRVSPKLAERLKIHTSFKQLHKNIDVACLPSTFGGQIPIEDMISYTKQLLKDQRKKLLSLDDMELLNNKGIVTSRSKCSAPRGDTASVEGSFRRLEID